MKKILIITLIATFSLAANASEVTSKPQIEIAVGGYFDVYLKNNCSKEIEVRVRADGSSSVSKYKSGEKVKVPVKAGYEVYVDGKLFKKFEDGDSGKEINLCK